MYAPVGRFLVGVATAYGHERTVDGPHVVVALELIRCSEHIVHTENLTPLLEEWRNEMWPVIRSQRPRHAVLEQEILCEGGCNVICRNVTQSYDLLELCEVVCDNKDD